MFQASLATQGVFRRVVEDPSGLRAPTTQFVKKDPLTGQLTTLDPNNNPYGNLAAMEANIPLLSGPSLPPASAAVERKEPALISTSSFRDDAKSNVEAIRQQALRIQENINRLAQQERERTAQAQTASFDPKTGLTRDELDAKRRTTIEEGLSPSQIAMRRQLEEESVTLRQEEEKTRATLDQLAVQADENAASLIQQIQLRFTERKTQMEDINRRSLAGLEQIGIRTGAQRRAGSFVGIMSAEERSGIQRLTDLDRQQAELILSAQEAARSGKYNILSTKMKDVEEKRKELNTKLTEFNKKVIEKNEEIAKRQQQASIESVIGDLMQQGITNPLQIQDFMNFYDDGTSTGGNVTIDEINKAMTALRPDHAEIQKLVGEIAKGQAPASVIKSVSQARTLTEALAAAGDYAVSGSGIVGEYLFYKRQQEATGKLSVDFDTYQTIDANRKARVAAAANAAGIDPKTQTVITNVSTQFNNAPIVKLFNEVLNKKTSVDLILQNGVGGPADLALVFEFMKGLDPTSVVREAEYYNAAKSGNIFKGVWAKFNGYMKEEGGFLPPNVRTQFQNLLNQKYTAAERQYDNFRSESAGQINKRTGRTDGEDFLIDYKVPVSQMVEDFKEKLARWTAADPANMASYEKLVSENPELSDADIAAVLGIPL